MGDYFTAFAMTFLFLKVTDVAAKPALAESITLQPGIERTEPMQDKVSSEPFRPAIIVYQ